MRRTLAAAVSQAAFLLIALQPAASLSQDAAKTPTATSPKAAATTTTTAAPAAVSAPAPRNQAATIQFTAGTVTLYDVAKTSRAPQVGGILNEGDRIVTGADGELHLDMQDGGFLSVRPNTNLTITKYQANGETTDTGVFSLLEGSFRSITGWIGKYNKDRYQVKSQTATIGIRGTDHEPFVLPAGGADGEAGLYDKVNEGRTFIQTPQGRIDLAKGQSGFAGAGAKPRPRLLKDVPRFFRPGRNDRLFEGRYKEIQDALEKRREQRRGLLKQKVEQGKAERREAVRREAETTAAEAKAKRAEKAPEQPGTLRERAQARKAEREEKKAEKLEKAEKTEKAAKAAKTEKAEKLEKAEKADKPEKAKAEKTKAERQKELREEREAKRTKRERQED